MKIWAWDKSAGSVFANISRLVSGPTHEKTLLVSKYPLQFCSLGTPSDQKVATMFEKLLALGVTGAEHDTWLIRIGDGGQLSSGFVEVNPSSEIPALCDHTHNPPIRVFESGSTLLHLVEKLGYFLPQDLAKRTGAMNQLFWLQGAAPFLGDDLGHFYHYAPVKIEYAINRFTVEAKRLLDALDRQLVQHKFVADDGYTVTDMAIWPQFGNVVLGGVYDAAEFLGVSSYEHVQRQAKEVGECPTVKRGHIVNRTNRPLNEQLYERHDASDLETSTGDKRQG